MPESPRQQLLRFAAEEEFAMARIAPATVLREARTAALAAHQHGALTGLDWMTTDWLTRATDPEAFLAGARSVLLLALPYAPAPPLPAAGPTRGRIAAYAQARDYHRVFETKLRRLAARVRTGLGADARPTVDYGPLLERPLAASAGMGWLGRSTMLLVPGAGPWVLLGALATTLDLEPDPPLRKSCGTCTRCIVACPTGALSPEGHLLDARRCISYHTIENRGPIPRDLRPRFGAWIFGCDDCLEACPVGRTTTATHPDFAAPTIDHATPELAPLLALDEAVFRERFQGRPIMRAKRDGFLRNVCIALGNTGAPADLPALLTALADTAPLVRGHAAWALARLAARHTLHPAATAALTARLPLEADPWVIDEIRAALATLAAPA